MEKLINAFATLAMLIGAALIVTALVAAAAKVL